MYYYLIRALSFIATSASAWYCKEHSSLIQEYSDAYLHRHWLSDIDPLAVCNDNTPGAYFFSPSKGDVGTKGGDTFVILLPGGGQVFYSKFPYP